MRTGLEFAGFASVSLVAHLAVFGATVPDGTASGGSGGSDAVTIAAPVAGADAELAALVRRWEAPVQMAAPPDAPPAPPAPPEAAPDLTAPAFDAPGLPSATALRTPGATQDSPQIMTDPPQLFAMPETRDTPRPPPRPEPRRAAPSPQTAPPAARAAGQGAQAQSGSGRAAQQSGTAPSASQMAQWGGAIRAAVQRRQSRPATRARGTVHLRLQVSAQGQLVSASIAQGSGHAALDQAALRAVQGARLPAAPGGISGTHHFNLPLSYR